MPVARPLTISSAAVVVAILVGSIVPSLSVIRLLVGVPLIMILPGYALVSIFDPQRELGVVERFAASIALSVFVTIAAGMALAASPVGISQTGALLAVGAFTLLANAIGMKRQPVAVRAPEPILSRPLVVPVVVAALSLAGMLVVNGVTIGNAAFRPSGRELIQLWMLPDAQRDDGGVRIGVDTRITTGSKFTLEVWQGSEVASDTPLTMGSGSSMLFPRTPLIDTTGTAPPLEARLNAAGGFTRSRHVTWWPR